MWNDTQTGRRPLSHDLPCPRCQHASHTYLPCSDSCACEPTVLPGDVRIAA